MTDTDPLDEPASAPPPRQPTFVLAVTLAVLFGLAAAALAVLLATGAADDDELDDLRSRAGQFAEALVTYDFEDPDRHRERVLGFATGSFREEYEDAFDQGLAQIISEVEAVSQGFVKDVYLSQVDEGQAQAVVVVDIEHDGAGGPRTLYDIYFRLTLVEVEGEWKVDQVTDLNFGTDPAPGGTDAPTDATESTTTSVP